VAASRGTVWVSNTASNTVTRIDARTGRVVAVVKVGESPVNLDVVGGDLWVPNDRGDTLSRISITTNRLVETVKTDKNPAVVAPVDGEVWASMFDAGSVWRIRPG
jgi:YVTN family beta-propeller protein